ncbi:MAG TPA: efflux RND transporter periplasmic adaptor subunit [Candidatus Acidoferrales bacterium]|nr:efflux RND transporter periplasmic adaptor subunit [Candidatus Acidoferrales bacterium]
MASEQTNAGPRKSWVVVAGGIVVVVTVVLILASRDQAPEVQVAKVKRENLSASISCNGKVEPIEPFVPRAQFATFIQKAEVTEGQSVHKGQVLLVLDANAQKTQLAKAQADLLAAQERLRDALAGGPPDQVAQLDADLRKAQIDLADLQKKQEELQKLVAAKAATQDELDQNGSKLAQQSATVEMLEQKKTAIAAQAAVSQQSARLTIEEQQDLIQTLQGYVRSATVISPIDGTLYSLPKHAGDYVQVGEPLAQVADLRHVRVRAFVDEPDLGVLAPGQTAEITWDGLPGYVWNGKTEAVPKQVTTLAVRSVGEVLCSVQNDNMKLIPNVNVDVRIQWSNQDSVLVIPRGAVHGDPPNYFVFVMDNDGTLHQRAIKLGIANPTEFQVVAGLQEGDRVALSGDAALRDGMSAHPVEAGQR